MSQMMSPVFEKQSTPKNGYTSWQWLEPPPPHSTPEPRATLKSHFLPIDRGDVSPAKIDICDKLGEASLWKPSQSLAQLAGSAPWKDTAYLSKSGTAGHDTRWTQNRAPFARPTLSAQGELCAMAAPYQCSCGNCCRPTAAGKLCTRSHLRIIA